MHTKPSKATTIRCDWCNRTTQVTHTISGYPLASPTAEAAHKAGWQTAGHSLKCVRCTTRQAAK